MILLSTKIYDCFYLLAVHFYVTIDLMCLYIYSIEDNADNDKADNNTPDNDKADNAKAVH
jgi:hypothetical protein